MSNYLDTNRILEKSSKPHEIVLQFSESARRLYAPGACALAVLQAIYAPIERAEVMFLQMNNLSTMFSQVCRNCYYFMISVPG